MQTITPPSRRKELAAVGPDMHEGPISDSEAAFSTPIARDARMFSWHRGPEGEISTMVPPAGTIPATPQTVRESNDGSQIKTPFSNFPPWNGGSPDVASTPTPHGVHSKTDARRMFPSIGNGVGFPTPQYPPELHSLTRDRQGPESPLAAKARLAQSGTQAKVSLSSSGNHSRSLTPEDAVVKPLILTTEPVAPPAQPTQANASEGEEIPESPDLVSPPLPSSVEESPLIAPAGSESPNEVGTSPLTKNLVKPATETPASILRWLEPPPRIQAARKFANVPERQWREDAVRRRLATFVRRTGLPSSLEPTDHDYLGRILQPRAKEGASNDIFAVPDWPDHVYPWVSPSLYVEANDSQRRRELQMIANYLDSSSGSEEEAQVPAGQVDPSDALLVLRHKKAARRRMGRLRTTPTQPPKAPSPPTSNDPVEAEIDSEMDVDKDSDEVACICRKPDDGRAMVQCDGCKTWHHLECVTKDPDDLPEKWFCWKCPAISVPGKGSDVVEPMFSVADSPAKNRFSTAANMPLYQAPVASNQSPRRNSHLQAPLTSSTLFESGRASLFDDRHTPSPLHAGFSRSPYGVWADHAGDMTVRPSTDKLDDPMTAIAATPFSGVAFMHSSFDDPTFDGLSASPSRHLGFRFTPLYATTPKKERPWTNYTGTFTTPTNATDSQYTSFPNQLFPAVQTDPLFIHYEHDAPKQTAHHHGGPAKGRRKGKNKGKGRQAYSDKTDGSSTQEANRGEVGDGTANETSASEPIGDTPPPSAGDQATQEMVQVKDEA